MNTIRSLISSSSLLALLASLTTAPFATAQETDAKQNWSKHCAKCHHEDGSGKTAMGRKLKLLDYTDPKVQEKLKDDEMFKVTKEGVVKSGKTVMKAYSEDLSDQEIKDLVAYIRKLKK